MNDQTKGNVKWPKLALFLPDLSAGGAEKVFILLAATFVEKGFHVDLLLASKNGPLLNDVAEGVNIIDLASIRQGEPVLLSALRTVFSLMRYLKSSAPTAMLTTLTGSNLTAIVAKKLSRHDCRLVIREAASLDNVRSSLRLRLMRTLYQYADEIVVLTEFMKSEMVASCRLPAEKVMVVDNPIDSERVRSMALNAEVNQVTKKMQPFATVVGRLTEQKDFMTAIRAVAHANNRSPFDLVIIGEGPLREALLLLAKSLNISDRIHFMGYQSNPYSWMKQSSLFILSSKWEGYPNVLLEAMSLGCSIIATEYDSSVCAILATYPECLYRIVSVGNEVEMADAIFELVRQEGITQVPHINNTLQVADKYLEALDVSKWKKSISGLS
jgi:glycosyltransferase involved in cell wall biosynthesis